MKATPRGRSRIYTAALLILLFSLAATVAVYAQERFGELSGVVTDSSKAVVPDASVTITNKGSGRVFTTKTGADGNYIARDLEPGRYTVMFRGEGFSEVRACGRQPDGRPAAEG